jgi:hypothetical protein
MSEYLKPFTYIWNQVYTHGGVAGQVMIAAVVICVGMLVFMWITGRRH